VALAHKLACHRSGDLVIHPPVTVAAELVGLAGLFAIIGNMLKPGLLGFNHASQPAIHTFVPIGRYLRGRVVIQKNLSHIERP